MLMIPSSVGPGAKVVQIANNAYILSHCLVIYTRTLHQQLHDHFISTSTG